MAKRKEDCLEKLIKDTGAKRDAAYDVLVKMLSELVKTKEKYDKLAGLLEKHGRVPDDLRDIETLCVEAGSDETLDRLMDIAGCDTLDDFEAFVQHWADYRKAHENMVPLAWIERYDHGDIITSPDFWDCGCQRDYIHPRKERKCKVCGARRDEQPESRLGEVLAYFENKLGIKYPKDGGVK